MTSVECRLKIALKSTTLSVTKIVDLKNKERTEAFYKKYKNIRRIHAFVKYQNIKNITESSYIEIPAISVPINDNEIQHKVFYVEIAVGNSLYVTKKHAQISQPPSFYDSFIVVEDENVNMNQTKKIDNLTIYKENGINQTKINIEGDRMFEPKGSSYREEEGDRYFDKRNIKNEEMLDMRSNASYEENITLHYENSINSSLRKNKPTKDIRTENKTKITNNISKAAVTTNETQKNTYIIENVDLNNVLYVIRDSSKINVLYEVSFNYDKAIEQGKGLCEMCHQNKSIMFCLAERASFCKPCDQKVHFNNFTKRHAMYYYDNIKNKKQFIQCPAHISNIADLYCEECKNVLCSLCKINGNHSNTPFDTHRIISFVDACDKIKKEMDEEDKKIEVKTRKLEEEVKEYKTAANKQFISLVEQIREKIDNEYKNAMHSLETIVNKKLQTINANIIFRRVDLEKCYRIHTFINDIDEGQCVRDYKSIHEQRMEIETKKTEYNIIPEKIIFKGSLNVYTEKIQQHSKISSPISIDKNSFKTHPS